MQLILPYFTLYVSKITEITPVLIDKAPYICYTLIIIEQGTKMLLLRVEWSGIMNNAVMNWNEIQKQYPDRWIAPADYKKDGLLVLEGVPIEVCEERDMYDAEIALRQKGIPFIWRRTTQLEGINVICRM